MMTRSFALIEWADASHPRDGGWVDAGDYSHDELVVFSAGWIISETKTAITIASTITPHTDGRIQGMHVIPRTQIRKLRRWKEGKR